MSVGSGLNPVLDYADMRQFFSLVCLDGNISGSSMCKCPGCCIVLLRVFSPFTLLYYLVLIFYACQYAVCTVWSCLYLYTTLLAWTLPFLDFVTAWIRMNPWND